MGNWGKARYKLLAVIIGRGSGGGPGRLLASQQLILLAAAFPRDTVSRITLLARPLPREGQEGGWISLQAGSEAVCR